MTRRASQPLNRQAVAAADKQFYQNHPELKGTLLSLTGPDQADLRSEWMNLYAAHGGKITTAPAASPTTPVVKCPPAASPGTLTEKQANDLFKELKNEPQIPFDYPVDCCYTRANEMCRMMESKGIECRKYWLFDENWGEPEVKSSLAPETDGKPVDFPNNATGEREPVRWVYHVAPTVKVQKADGSVEEMVMDPSIESGPVTKKQWRETMGDPHGDYAEDSDSKAYFQNQKKGYREDDPDGTKTKEQLEKHRKSRDEALKSGGTTGSGD